MSDRQSVPPRVLGVVLAGGRSSRMGTTKVLVDIAGRPMGTRIIDALRAGGCDPVIIVGGDPDELAVLGVPFVPDRFPGEGPAGGLLSALDWAASGAHADDWVLVVSCDLPALDGDTVGTLVAAVASADADTSVIVAVAERVEPALAVWRVGAVDAVRASFAAGERALHRVLAAFDPVRVRVASSVVQNVNTPDDLARFRESVARESVVWMDNDDRGNQRCRTAVARGIGPGDRRA